MNLGITKQRRTTAIYRNGFHPAVDQLDFSRLKWKLSSSSEAKLSAAEADSAEVEYKRFLTLKKHYPDVSLVPNRLVDEFWHAHILDTRAYREDCDAVFGFYLDHFPYFGIYGDDDRRMLNNSFKETKRLYEKHFGEYPASAKAARCEDHSCHVPSACACRVPGACK